MSLSPQLNRKQVFNAGEGSGKSGSFFFFSHDKQFIIKTVKEAELEALKIILPKYIAYLKKNPFSMIAKIYGVFTLRRSWMKPVTVMLMENTLQICQPSKLVATFDLKGSTHGRKSKSEVKPSTIQKDLDLVEMRKRDKKLFAMSDLNRKLERVLL